MNRAGGVFLLFLSSLMLLSCTTPRTAERPEYVEVDRLLVVAHPTAGIVGVRRPVRAWMDTTEQGTRAASRLVSLDVELGIRGFDVAKDGTLLVFSQAVPSDAQNLEPPPGYTLLDSCNIRGFALSGGGMIEVTVGSYLDIDPFFDRDGKHILFASNRRRRGRADLLRIESRQRSGIEDVYVNTLQQIVLSPSMASDGTICFCLFPGEGSNEPPQIWTIAGPRGYATQVGLGTAPRLSPDATRIAYVGADGNLWVMDTSGSSNVQLTFNADQTEEKFRETLTSAERDEWDSGFIDPYAAPSWTPDGASILYSSMESLDGTGRPNQDIWIMSAAGANKKQLTSNGSLDTLPVCSPDGRYAFFVSNRGGRWAIWRIDMPAMPGATDNEL